MPDKLVFVKTLANATDKHGKTYLKVTDQNNTSWNLFGQVVKVEISKAYLFSFETNEQGYDNVTAIKPLVNLFQEKALKEVANRNDIWRNISVSFSYAKDLVTAGLVGIGVMYELADKIYDYIQTKTDKLFEAKHDEPSV